MKQRYKICLLEEDPFLSGLYARKFELRGWKVDVIEKADDVDGCLDGVDLLIVDIENDGYKARDVVRRLASDVRWRGLPVVVLTEVSDRAVVREMVGYGVAAYLIKGHFVPNEVVEKIHTIIETNN